MTDQHKCPKCGKPTEGSWSWSGHKWALCPDCLDRYYYEEDVHNSMCEDDWRKDR